LHTLFKDKESLGYIFETVAANDDDENQFHVPLFKNRENKTALDYTLNYCDKEKENEVQTERNEKKGLMLNLVESRGKENQGE